MQKSGEENVHSFHFRQFLNPEEINPEQQEFFQECQEFFCQEQIRTITGIFDRFEQFVTENDDIKGGLARKLQKYGELGIRDIILKSICPDVYGMYPIKLALALAICSGNELSDIKSNDQDELHHRGQSHVLLVGDPGLAKSKLLLSAVEIAPRAVHTTGMGCSSAGLTAAAVKEDGEWVLEA